MNPERAIIHQRAFVILILTCSFAVMLAFAIGAIAWKVRSHDIDRLLMAQQQLTYQNCVSNELQDSVIVTQLRAAKMRAMATLPPGATLYHQLEVIDDGIAALEPPGEPDCQPPEGTQP